MATSLRNTLLGTIAVIGLATGSVVVRADIMPGLPDAIVCSVKDPTGILPWEKLVYYVSARMTDGRTLYKTLTSDPVVLLVTPEGVVDGENLADCDGRSVDALREVGQAYSLTGSR